MRQTTVEIHEEESRLVGEIRFLTARLTDVRAELLRRFRRATEKRQAERRKASIPNPIPFNERAERDVDTKEGAA